ncbi:MAG: enoyl-CoA hydratase/isomerase family protein [Cytophagaceae bacterium]
MDLVLLENKDRLAYITINRPEKRNALNFEVVKQLKEKIQHADQDDSVKVIILTGAGEVFCAGADLEYLQTLQKNSYDENLKDSLHLKELFELIYFLKKPVIAQVNGHAIAGGCGLVSVCDFAFSIPEANFGYTEVRIGFVPAIVSYFLLKKAGELKAKELLLTGKIIAAEEAINFNLINEVVEEKKLNDHVEKFANNLCTNNSGQSMAITKKMIADLGNMNVSDALNYASEQNAFARGTEDCKKGIAAFLNKEKIKW